MIGSPTRSRGLARLMLLVLPNLASDRCPEGFANRFDGDAIKNLLEEAGNDHSHGFPARKSSRLGVEDEFLIDPAAGTAVCAAYIVSLDLETWDRVRSGLVAEHQIIVALITIGLLRSGVDLDHAAPDCPGSILENRFVKEVAGAMWGNVMLQRVVDQMLFIACEHNAVDLATGAGLDQGDPLIDLGKP